MKILERRESYEPDTLNMDRLISLTQDCRDLPSGIKYTFSEKRNMNGGSLKVDNPRHWTISLCMMMCSRKMKQEA